MATHSGVLEIDDDFLNARVRAECERLIPKTVEITHEDCVDAFLSLKAHFILPQYIFSTFSSFILALNFFSPVRNLVFTVV